MVLQAIVLVFLIQQAGDHAAGDTPVQAAAAAPIRVMTFNIRYGTAEDGENRWEKRRELLLETIREAHPDLLGLQESLDFQIDAIHQAFPIYDVYGKGREPDGGGEHSSLLVRRDRFEIHAHGTFWLSETPQVAGSKSWDAALPRICSWAKLHDRVNGGFLAVFNTHFDHRGSRARLESARIILERVDRFDGLPVIVMGDFNAPERSRPMTELLGEGLRDTYRVLHPDLRYAGTFNGFMGRQDGEKIDAILVNRLWKVLEASIVRKHHEKRFPSDHFPVTAVLRAGH